MQSKTKIYSYECKLQPVIIKDTIFKNIRHKLDFASPYLTYPNIVLMATGNGPANFTKPISEKDMKMVADCMTSVIKPPVTTSEPDHKKTIEHLKQIGEALGFDAHVEQEYTLVAPGAIVDMIWEIRMGNMGVIKYSIEVQSKGSIKSLINNLISSMNDPAVKKVVAVSDTKQLEQIRNLVENTNAYTTTAKSMFVFLDTELIKEFVNLLPKLNEFKKILSV